jgi:hypothetical protein
MQGFLFTKQALCWALVAHTYNPSYSGSKDQGRLQFEASSGK